MKHKHRIVPGYMGGTYDKDNVVMLTVEEHAEAHKVLYELHGNIEDLRAWQGLAGIVPREELIKTLCSDGGKKGGSVGGKLTAEIHRSRNTGMFSEDHEFQKKGAKAGAHLGGLQSLKNGTHNFLTNHPNKKVYMNVLNGDVKSGGSWRARQNYKEVKPFLVQL